MDRFYRVHNGAVHRSMHALSEKATEAYEAARKTVADFLHASHADEILFTKNATEAINLVARSWGETHLKKGDTVVLTTLEHHSNSVPWLQLKERLGIEVEWIECDSQGSLDLNQYEKLLDSGRVKLVALTGQSNVLGVRPALHAMITQAHAAGALVLVDAAQLAAHDAINVTELDCDFLVFSGHKVYGPTGIGVLYGKRELLKRMPPFLGGGEMVREVTRTGFTPADAPQKFEAGTPPVAEAIGLAAALKWLQEIPLANRTAHEAHLLDLTLQQLLSVPGLRILGPANTSRISGCISFTMNGIHPHDIAEILSKHHLLIRAGNHCAQVLHDSLGIPASARISIAIYNTETEIALLAPALLESKKILSSEY